MIWNWIHNAEILQEHCIGNSVCTQNHIYFIFISAESARGKMMEQILLKTVDNKEVIADSQHGFTKGK